MLGLRVKSILVRCGGGIQVSVNSMCVVFEVLVGVFQMRVFKVWSLKVQFSFLSLFTVYLKTVCLQLEVDTHGAEGREG